MLKLMPCSITLKSFLEILDDQMRNCFECVCQVKCIKTKSPWNLEQKLIIS